MDNDARGAGRTGLLRPSCPRLFLGFRDPDLMDCAILGMWAFTNLEMAYAQLRVDERARAYLYASMANVAMTVTFTVLLVVFADQQASGLLLGNFGASAHRRLRPVVVLARARRFSLRLRVHDLRAMLRFGVPTVPADASVYALQVVDRLYLFRVYSQSAAGLYSIALQLATVVFLAGQGLSVRVAAAGLLDQERQRGLTPVLTGYHLLRAGDGLVVCGVALLGRWLVRLLAAPEYFGAYKALPWLALGWALYGLYPVLMVIAGRAGITTRNFPAALAGLGANVVLLLCWSQRAAWDLGIAGAGIALCGAYLVMLSVMYLLTRSLFAVGFEWLRLALLCLILAGVAVSGELLLPTHGFAGLVLRVLWLMLAPVLLLASRFFSAQEIGHARELVRSIRRYRLRGPRTQT